MVKAVVLYGPPEDPDAFERHYADTRTFEDVDALRAGLGVRRGPSDGQRRFELRHRRRDGLLRRDRLTVRST